jgi:hypothetical protein
MLQPFNSDSLFKGNKKAADSALCPKLYILETEYHKKSLPDYSPDH